MKQPARYRSGEEDSARWLEFEFRDGDIVISTRSKHGTTWMQMICALLVFESPQLPRPLAELSPWLDWLVVPERRLFARLDEQDHRRFIKTHTPLDGLPLDERAHFVVVARHPLDAALSLYHQSHNIDRQRVAELTGSPTSARPPEVPSADSWLRGWIASDADAVDELDSFNGVFHHLTDAWHRRDDSNVLLVHYADLAADLRFEMCRIADALGFDIGHDAVSDLSVGASFDAMRANADDLAPDPSGVLKNKSQFFRSGKSAGAMELLAEKDVAAYEIRAMTAAPDDLLEWLHRY